MRVLAVAQVEGFLEGETQGLRECSRIRLQSKRICADTLERGSDGGIVSGGGREGFLREVPLGCQRERAAFALEFVGDGLVVGGGRYDGDVVKILGGGADHGRAADVDVLDQFLE